MVDDFKSDLDSFWGSREVEAVLNWLLTRKNDAFSTSINRMVPNSGLKYEEAVRVVRVLEAGGLAKFERRRGVRKSRVYWPHGARYVVESWAQS